MLPPPLQRLLVGPQRPGCPTVGKSSQPYPGVLESVCRNAANVAATGGAAAEYQAHAGGALLSDPFAVAAGGDALDNTLQLLCFALRRFVAGIAAAIRVDEIVQRAGVFEPKSGDILQDCPAPPSGRWIPRDQSTGACRQSKECGGDGGPERNDPAESDAQEELSRSNRAPWPGTPRTPTLGAWNMGEYPGIGGQSEPEPSAW